MSFSGSGARAPSVETGGKAGGRRVMNWGELALPIVFIGVWLLLQLVVLPRLGVST